MCPSAASITIKWWHPSFEFSMPDLTADALAAAAAAQKEAATAVDETAEEVDAEAVEVATRAAAESPELSAEDAKAIGKLAAAVRLDTADAGKLYHSGIDKPSTLLQQASTPRAARHWLRPPALMCPPSSSRKSGWT